MTHSQLSIHSGASFRFFSWSGCFSMIVNGPDLMTFCCPCGVAQPISVKDNIISIVFMIFSSVHRQYVLLRNSSTIVFINHKQAIDSGY